MLDSRWGRIGAVALWSVLVIALLPAARDAEERFEVGARVPGSESAEVERLLAERIGSPFAQFAIVVVTGAPGPATPEGRAVLTAVTSRLEAVPGVTRAFSWLDAPDPLFRGSGGGTFVVVGLDPEGGADARIAPLRAALAGLGPELREAHPALRLELTGEAALNHDLRTTSGEEASAAEARVLPLTLLLLVVIFGALAAAMIPVLTGALTIPLAIGLAGLISLRWPLSILLVNVVTMIGLGLGIDYALLAVSRFREALAEGLSARAAAAVTVRRAGHTVALSGLSVMLGFAGLLLIPLGELRSIGVGGMLVTLLAVLIVLTLLPAVLAWLGPRVDAGRLRRRRGGDRGRERWRRWGAWVAAHPKRVMLIAGAPVLLLAFQATRLRTEIPRGDWLPPAMESARGLESLRAMERGSLINAIRVVVELPDGVTLWDPRGWEAVGRLGGALGEDPLVARVRSLPELAPPGTPAAFARGLPDAVRRTFASDDGGAVLIELLPAERAEQPELSALVRRIRAADHASRAGVAGARIHVGGLPAFNVDYTEAVGGRLAAILALVVGGTLVALGIGFRSVLIPIKAVALNLLSVAAAFGALVLGFQEGHLAWLFGLDGPTGGMFPNVPVLVFCIVFGLSMDYEVFLVARVAEARRSGASERDALAEGVARTGGIITGAAAIMIVVFAAFALGEFLLIQMLGFALAVAVFLDATVVRMALGPALLALAGRWNWWPGVRGRPEPPRRAEPRPEVPAGGAAGRAPGAGAG